MDTTARREALEAAEKFDRAATRNREWADALIDQYGEGVRPSWVSSELTMYLAYAAQYETAAEILREAVRKDEEQ